MIYIAETDIPKLGHHFEICFSVDNLQESIKFYKKLGFKICTGGSDKGWCTITDGTLVFPPIEGWSSQQITQMSRDIVEFMARLSKQTVRQNPKLRMKTGAKA